MKKQEIKISEFEEYYYFETLKKLKTTIKEIESEIFKENGTILSISHSITPLPINSNTPTPRYAVFIIVLWSKV